METKILLVGSGGYGVQRHGHVVGGIYPDKIGHSLLLNRRHTFRHSVAAYFFHRLIGKGRKTAGRTLLL